MSRELHGVAVYNPDLLAKHELVSLFVARRPLLDRLVRDLHDEAEAAGVAQHHLIVGRRGMGKTTLLRRLRYAIEDDPDLDARFVALVFPEEQYNVASLSDFWLNCVDALADSLESRGRREALAIDEQVAAIAAVVDEAERRVSALSLLLSHADHISRRMVLLIDNLDLVFARIARDDWALREILSREPRLLLIGATSQALESSFRYDQAFYDFFRIHQLGGLDETQSFEIMRHLAEMTKQPRVLEVIDRDPGRIEALRLLSGGNPRTLVLLFNLLSQGTEGDACSDLERLLDQLTPLYKHQFEELPAQAQRAVDGLALGWDPMTARDLADRLRLDINQTSAQLNRLVKQGIVEKTRLPGTIRTGFQLSERFFNIWYLMRASRRMRRRLIFLVKFLELFVPKPALRAQALPDIPPPPDPWPSELARQLLIDGKPSREAWEETMMLFSQLVHHGHTRDARVLVQSLPNAEAWTPLVRALEVLERGSAELMRALSPELRAASELALSRLAPELAARLGADPPARFRSILPVP